MYFLIQHTGISAEEPVFIIESPLERDVTLRLLLHTSPGHVELLGYCSDIEWAVLPDHKTRTRIGDWIDPGQFLRLGGSKDPPDLAKWSLLARADMEQLLQAWRESAKYNNRESKDGEYFRNRVSSVESLMEDRWPLQKKSAGESIASSKGPSTGASTGSSRRRARPRKTGS